MLSESGAFLSALCQFVTDYAHSEIAQMSSPTLRHRDHRLPAVTAPDAFAAFEVLSSRLKPGCAESAIVNGILDLMAESRAHR
jgi:hypothetical protein